ncbi:MAG: hypothetical protein U0Q19_08835 [Kineosporiaceae bacterium]
MNITHIPSPRTALDELRERRAARAADRQLRRELAAYDTPAAIADLMAVVDRADGPQADEIRGVLAHNLLEYNRRTAIV